MHSLPRQRTTLLQRLQNCLPRFSASLGPVWAMASIALAFYGGMQLDRFLQVPAVVEVSRSMPAAGHQPLNAEALFYLGRSLLASDQPEEALSVFRRAAMLQPDNPQYTLWQGSAYYALGKAEEERRSYQQLLDSRPDYLPARLNLAHNLLQNGLPGQARRLYEEVLQRAPTDKTALYNRALAFHLQHEKSAEAGAWRQFLSQYRTGIWASRALRHLHATGDYSYRRYQIGYRSIILNQDLLLGSPGSKQNQEIKYLTDLVSIQPSGEINIIVFQEGDVQQAKRIARTLRRAVINQVPNINHKDVRISWFGESERIETPNGDREYLPAGVLIFSAPKKNWTEERI